MKTLKFGTVPVAKLPKKAGDAILRYYREIEQPFRDGNEIFIPYKVDWGLREMESGPLVQVVLDSPRERDQLYFAGTDEAPFLSRLDVDLERIEEEEKFLSALKPKIVSTLEGLWQVLSGRQGDWFYVQIPNEYDSVSGMAKLYSLLLRTLSQSGLRINPGSVYLSSSQLNKTRHMIEDGEVFEVSVGLYLARGVLRAPDHSDRKLDGYHFLAQAVGFYNEETRETAD